MTEKETSLPKITKIETQKRKERYNIYVDGEYAFPVDEAILIKYVLHKGMEMPTDLMKKIMADDTERKYYNQALGYISYRLRSEKEVRQHLKEKEATPDTIEKTIQKLKEQKYLDDQIYGDSFVRTAATISQKGPGVLKQEMKLKGLKDEVINQALTQYSNDQLIENALKLAEKTWKKHRNTSQREAKNKVQQMLFQKGYTQEVIQQVLVALDTEKSPEDEYESVQTQGAKIWRKNQRHDLRKRIQKTKQSLYQKGFPADMITQFIEEVQAEEE